MDKRVWRNYLTPAGKRLVKKLMPIAEKHREEIYACLTKQQQRDLSQALDVVIAKLFALQD
jgi:DNA-binding MarR family transcriptional regulator